MSKHRIRRRDLKKPDEFLTVTGRALTWARENYRIAALAGGALFVVLAIGGLLGALRTTRIRDANADFGRAMAALRAENLGQAATEFGETNSRWSTTRIAPLAELLEASTRIQLGEADAAISRLEALRARSSELPEYLRQQLLLNWAAALEAKQAWPDAAARYAEAAAATGPYTADALLAEARLREKTGEGDRAKELYRKVRDEVPEAGPADWIAARAAG